MTIDRPTAADPRREPAVRPEAGFTLVEVIVALALLGLLSTAALYFFVNGTRTITHQQRSHGAVSSANDAMEQVFSYVPQMAGATAATASSGLLTGRLDSDVTAAWNEAVAAGVTGLSETYPAWDRATMPAPLADVGDDRVKLTRTVTASGVKYQVTTLIGYCYRVAANPNGACTRVGGDSVGNPNAGYVRMLRAVVVVSWPGTTSSCTDGTCRYQIQSLIDPNTDLKWNNTTRLQAFDDAVQVNAGESVMIDVLANDSLMELSNNPVSWIGEPKRGGTPEGVATLHAGSGKIEYTASPDGYGEVTFAYKVEVAARTTQATVHVYITPRAPDLHANVIVGQVVELPVTSAAGVTPGSLVLTQTPSAGTLTMPGGGTPRFRYQAPTAPGTYQFRYTYVDSAGTTSLAGNGTIVVANYLPAQAPTVVYPLSGAWTSAASATARTVDVRANSGNPGGYLTTLRSVPSGGTLNVGVGSPTPNALTWTQPRDVAGEFSFTYSVTAPDGTNGSPVGTALMRVTPVARNVEVTIKRNAQRTTSGSVDLAGSPVPAGAGTVTYAVSSGSSCRPNSTAVTARSATTSPSQTFEVARNAGATTCTYTYTMSVLTPSGAVLTSAPANLTVKVTT